MCSRSPRSGPCGNERTTRFAAFVGRSLAIWNLVPRQIKPYLSWFKKLERLGPMSGCGTNAKCRRALNLSAFRGIPEVMAHVQKLGRHFKTKP